MAPEVPDHSQALLFSLALINFVHLVRESRTATQDSEESHPAQPISSDPTTPGKGNERDRLQEFLITANWFRWLDPVL